MRSGTKAIPLFVLLACATPDLDKRTPPLSTAQALSLPKERTTAIDVAPPVAKTPSPIAPVALPMMGEGLDGGALDAPLPAIDDPQGQMARFYERLASLLRSDEAGRSPRRAVRVAVYGDSNGTADWMTGDMRKLLQARFGDGGHGFVALVKPWTGYRHRFVRHDLWKDSWEAFTVTTHPSLDLYDRAVTGYYGHGLIAAESKGPGGVTWVATADPSAPIGTRASRAGVSFLKRPNGGAFEFLVDGKVKATVSTRADEIGAGFHHEELPDGPHKVEFIPRGFGRVRLLGAVLEREAGIVVDSLGVGSLNCLTMLRDHDKTNRETLAERAYDLVIFHIGSNTFTPKDVAPCMRKLFARHREALPAAAFLVMSPPDFLETRNPPRTVKWLLDAIAEQKEVARETGVAFFDFHQMMGGEGSMMRFYEHAMTGDFVHFNEKGGAYVGARVVAALLRGLDGYVQTAREREAVAP